MMSDIAQLSIQVNSTSVNDAQQSLDRLTTSGNACEGAMGVLEKAAAKVAAAFAAWEVIEKLQSSIMSYARYETLGVAMEQIGRNAGYSASQMAQFQSQLQETGISMLESRNNLTRMASAQLDLSKASELARVAQDAAVVAGINSSEAFERLVQGIVSGQPKILHTMGIFADFKGVEDSLAKAHGETSKELTTAEAAQARMNAVLDEGAQRAGAYEAAMGTAGKQITSMQRYIDNLEVQFGEAFGPALTSVIAYVTDTLKDASKAMEDWKNSGELGMEQAHLKGEVQGLISTISSGTQFIYAHRDAILILGAALAGLKVADVVKSMGQWVITQRDAVLANVIAARADVEAASQKLLVAQANVIESNTLIATAEAKQAATIATNELSNAEARLAEQETATAIAGKAANAALGSVGGVFGIITMAITGAAMAWSLFHDKMNQNSKDALTAADSEIAATEKKIKAIQDYYNHATSRSNAENALHGPDDDPAIRALDKQYGDWQTRAAQIQSQIKNYSPGLAIQGDIGVESTEDLDSLNKRLKDVQGNMDGILTKRQKLVEDLNNLKLLQDRFQNEQTGNVPSHDAGTTTEYRDTEYGREVNKLQEELLKLTVSEREAYEMKLRLMDNGKSGNVDEAMGLYDQIETTKRWIAEQKTSQQEGANIQDTLMGLQDAYDKVALSERELLAIKLADGFSKVGTSVEETKEKVKSALAVFDETKRLSTEKQAQKKIDDYTDSLNQKDDYQTKVDRLNESWATGRLTIEAYQKESHKLLLESNTLWGAAAYEIENFADRGSEALASFFNGTKTGFRDMVSSLLVDIEKLILKEQVVAPMLRGITGFDWASLFGGSGGENIGSSSGGSGIGMAPTSTGASFSGANFSAPAASGSSVNQTTVNVHLHQDGSATREVSSTQGQALGKQIDAAVEAVIAKNLQPGGLLNRNH